MLVTAQHVFVSTVWTIPHLACMVVQMQAGIDAFLHRISGLEGDKAAVEEQLKRTHNMVTCLQV